MFLETDCAASKQCVAISVGRRWSQRLEVKYFVTRSVMTTSITCLMSNITCYYDETETNGHHSALLLLPLTRSLSTVLVNTLRAMNEMYCSNRCASSPIFVLQY
jgi:hypothetical protein